MKTLAAIITLNIIIITTYGQVKFENGYFINNNNQKTECLIRNYDQKNSPTEIVYKTHDNADEQIIGIDSIKEFSITDNSKFIRVKTNIDRSSNDLSKLTNNSSPEWSDETLFLRVLIESKALLFLYEDKYSTKFFYSVADSDVKQLIYKQYRSADDKYLLENNSFRQQLWTEIRCKNAEESSVKNLQYTESALIKYFSKYNMCSDSTNKVYTTKKTKNPFHLKINTGFTIASATFAEDDPAKRTYFDKEIDYRLGIEFEYVLPVNKNKWRIVLEPSYQHYSSESENFLGSAKIEYKSLEFPLGLRYYIFLNDNLNIFANAFYVFNSGINFNSEITLGYAYAGPVLIETQSCLAFGIGLNYKRLSSELRYNTPRNIDGNKYGSEFKVSSFIVSYRIF